MTRWSSRSTTFRPFVHHFRGRYFESVIRRYIKSNQDTELLDMQAEGFVVLGQVLAAHARDDEARQAFGRALDLYSRKGNTVSVASTNRHLEELTGGHRL